MLVLDMENPSQVDIELTYCEEQDKLLIEAGAMKRFGVEIPKCNILSVASSWDVALGEDDDDDDAPSSQARSHKSRWGNELQQIVTAHVCDAVHITWTMVGC